MGLETRVVPVAELNAATRGRMLALMRRYYLNVEEQKFQADLAGKQWVIMLEAEGALWGFSTQVMFEHEAGGRRVRVLFSGDTIIDRRWWRTFALPMAWGRLVFSILDEPSPLDLYWLLTSKGYKTYRFLPVFFREYWPRQGAALPPFERDLALSLGLRLWPERFDPRRWVIAAEAGGQTLRPGVAELDPARLLDPHVAFFEAANPGHAEGDELLCVARCHPDNFLPFMYGRARRSAG